MNSSQHIGCKVKSCKHNDQASACNLGAIEVAPCANMGSGKVEDESMCASYYKR